MKDRFKELLKGLGATDYRTTDGTKLQSIDDAVNHMFKSYVGDAIAYKTGFMNSSIQGSHEYYNYITSIMYKDWATSDIATFISQLQNNDTVPLPGAPVSITQKGYLLDQDQIPAMDRAGYIKLRHQLSDTVGVEAWKLNSFGEGAYDDQGHEMKIADVIGVGSQIRLGDKAMLSFDYGQNRAAMGRYFHGGMGNYGEYTGGGSTPDFWVARLDIGRADTDVPGSWNAFLDYKSFDHGAFLGGNGTASLPDRYLDGIRSFTAGIGYVPSKNLLLEAFYTFDAHSTQTRDTLYMPESFDLGDYTRIQATYKF